MPFFNADFITMFVQSKLAEAEEDAASQFERVSELENEVMLMEARATSAEASQQQLQLQLQEAASKPVSYSCLAHRMIVLNPLHLGHLFKSAFCAADCWA